MTEALRLKLCRLPGAKDTAGFWRSADDRWVILRRRPGRWLILTTEHSGGVGRRRSSSHSSQLVRSLFPDPARSGQALAFALMIEDQQAPTG
jgi:hypothetical protein